MQKQQTLQGKEEEKLFKLQDEVDKNSTQKEILTFQLSSNIVKISFFQLFKYSEIIQEEYLNGNIIKNLTEKLQKFLNKGYVQEENVLLFFKLLQDEEVQILSYQYCDLCKLSELFKVTSLQRYLNKYAKQHSNDVDFIINLMINQKTGENDDLFSNDKFSINFEEILIDNIQNCLKIPSFGKLPASTIYRIIEKSDKQQIQDDLLYDYISNSLSERFTLFHFINLQNLSDSKLFDLCEKYENANDSTSNSYYEYLPNNLMHIKSLREKKHNLENCIQKLEGEKKEFQILTKELTENKNKMEKEIMKLNENIKELQSQINNLCSINDQKQAEIKQLTESNDDLIFKMSNLIKDNEQVKLELLDTKEAKNLIQEEHEKTLIHINKLEKENTNSYFEIVKAFISYIDNVDRIRYIKVYQKFIRQFYIMHAN